MSEDNRLTIARDTDVEITPAMMHAGREAFLETMLNLEYLAVAPTDHGLDEVVSSVFRSMSRAKPSDLSHIT